MINRNVYSEVFELLGYMDKITVMKIPIEILNKIKENKNDEYISKIDKNNIFNRDNVLPETIKYIAWIDVNFWESKEEKERLKKIHLEKIKEEEKIKSNRYKTYDLFKNKYVETSNNNFKVDSMIEYKENIFKKFFKFIRDKIKM